MGTDYDSDVFFIRVELFFKRLLRSPIGTGSILARNQSNLRGCSILRGLVCLLLGKAWLLCRRNYSATEHVVSDSQFT